MRISPAYWCFVIVVVTVMSAPIGGFAQNPSDAVEARKRQLQAELDLLEQDIANQELVVNQKKQETQSLQRDVDLLNAEIRRSELSIQARDFAIDNINGDIVTKQAYIELLNEELDREKQSLAQLIRRKNQIDDFSLVEVMMGNKNLSEFFIDVDSFNEINEGLTDSFIVIENTKQKTEGEKVVLAEKIEEEQSLKHVQILEKQRIEEQEDEVSDILEVTKGEERHYTEVLKAKQKTAAQIRAELFALRDSAAIPFGRALELAERAEAQTGVRAALILGILTQETKLGEFLGNGDWRTDMHPTRDLPVFIEIMEELGLDPDSVPVSKAPSYGYGGAMGPAQFIPSTWVIVKDEVAELTGHNPPNPWDPEDAFMASAILLRDNGASKGTWEAERLAALRYFAGWKNATNPRYAFYGNSVMEFAENYQEQIEILKSS